MRINCKLRAINHKLPQGQAALSLVFLIGGIALLVSVTLSLVAINFLNSTFAFQSANKAMAQAVAGVEDALMRLDRDSVNFGGAYGVPYNVPNDCTNGCASVTVTKASNQATIVSTATVFASRRKIQAVAAIDPNTAQISVVSWTSLTL